LSHVDRSVFTDNNKLNIKSLIKNLKNMIIKKLSVLCIVRSLIFSSSLSVSFSATLSQSSTSIFVSDSLTSAISVSVTLTSATSDFIISAFIISSSQFKKMLYRLNKSYLLVYTLSLFLLTLRIIYYIHVFRNRNINVILFYTHEHEAYTSYLRYH
ncbi:hypothetical protein BDDG_11570, partial [Blastomyces dermatitidis ATCC 18188]